MTNFLKTVIGPIKTIIKVNFKVKEAKQRINKAQ